METEIKTEGVVDTKNNAGEGEAKNDFVSIPKAEFEILNQTLGSLKRENKDLRKSKDEPKKDTSENKPQSSDLSEKAFLIANGIKGADEMEFVQKLRKETGKDIESLLDSTYFQTELKDFREKRNTDRATPVGNKRSGSSPVDTVEYWIAKGELPPADQVQLRRDVVNARMKKEDSKGQFYNS